MANILKILFSKVTGNTPVSLVDGQIAINQKDKILFYPDENNVVQNFSIAGGAAVKGVAIITIPSATLTHAQTITVPLATATSIVNWSWGIFLDTDENCPNLNIIVTITPLAGQLIFKLEAINNYFFRGNYKINFSI